MVVTLPLLLLIISSLHDVPKAHAKTGAICLLTVPGWQSRLPPFCAIECVKLAPLSFRSEDVYAAAAVVGCPTGRRRFHHINNAFACDQSIFSTVGSVNPALTGLTLARRLAEHLAT